MKPHQHIRILHVIPKRLLSRVAGAAAQSRASKAAIPLFIRKYGVCVEEAAHPVVDYSSLMEFFCRELKPGLRPVDVDESTLVSPVDGRIAAFGVIQEGAMIQAKGVHYSAARLLGDATMARRFEGGLYTTIYLSPTDYHRVHAPAAGTVERSTYIPGTLWPVNQAGVQGVQGLFEKNERLVTYLSSHYGLVALVKVGACIVGGVRVNYDSEQRTNRVLRTIRDRTYHSELRFDKGQEIGRFEFGSTVILLTEPGRFEWIGDVRPGQVIRMGEAIMRVRGT